MKKTLLFFCIFIHTAAVTQTHITRFELSGGKQSPTYFELIDWWKKLDQGSGKVKMLTMGPTDAGYPLHLILIANNGVFGIVDVIIKSPKSRTFLAAIYKKYTMYNKPMIHPKYLPNIFLAYPVRGRLGY